MKFLQRYNHFFLIIAGFVCVAFQFAGCESNRPFDKEWQQLFFSEIDRVVKLADTDRLGTKSLNEGAIEVRIWRGFGTTPLEGLILKYDLSDKSAVLLTPLGNSRVQKEEIKKHMLQPPKSGWDIFWKQLEEKQLLTLPDASEIGCKSDQLDGIGYVVEIQSGSKYRTYMYGQAECKEARRMSEIGAMIADEFGSVPTQGQEWRWFIPADE